MGIGEDAGVFRRVPHEEFPMASPAPQPPAPEPPGKPAPPPADGTPRDPGTAKPKPADDGALFRALVDAGIEATLAYTVEKRMHAMTTETAAAQIQPVLAELREMRESMVTKADLAEFATKADLADFATKADLADFATKADLAEFVTKADLAEFVTKADLAKFGTQFVTKADLAEFGTRFATKADLSNLETRMVRWMFGALMAHAVLTVALVVGFMSVMR